jgi:hypothetical protein
LLNETFVHLGGWRRRLFADRDLEIIVMCSPDATMIIASNESRKIRLIISLKLVKYMKLMC